jgi:enamine deaminase RidA (YjgF/YER057c/UK114 family)
VHSLAAPLAGALAAIVVLRETATDECPRHSVIVPENARMASDIEARLKALGIVLPPVPAPQANYVPTMITGKLIFVSGQVPSTPEGVKFVGKIGREFSIEDGQQAARICAINILANLKAGLGDLEKLARIVKVTGFVNAIPDFSEPHKVVNGASDLLVEVLGERGRHSRSAVGVATLPLGVAVEVEAIGEIV